MRNNRVINKYEVFLWGAEKVLKLKRAGSCTTLWIHKIPLSCHPKMVSCMLSEFYVFLKVTVGFINIFTFSAFRDKSFKCKE